MKPKPLWSLNHFTVPLAMITSSFLNSIQNLKLEDAALGYRIVPTEKNRPSDPLMRGAVLNDDIINQFGPKAS
jgi:hypothetical protein